MSINLSKMLTESRNPASEKIDIMSTFDMLQVINNEDKKVAFAVESCLPEITLVVDKITQAFSVGGRLVYIGAGTSGRMGILDASECPPTFGTDPGQVVGVIAGGPPAVFKAVENAEDNPEFGKNDLERLNFSNKDILVGIAASGRTPYVLGAMAYAKSLGASVVSLVCNPESEMAHEADIAIIPVVGPEVVTGSSRLKAGTAQKMVLNMLTTGAMIKSGKVYGNLMVDVEATNLKLIERQKRIVMQATQCSREKAEKALRESGNHCKTAIVMILTGSDVIQAQKLLDENKGFVRNCSL